MKLRVDGDVATVTLGRKEKQLQMESCNDAALCDELKVTLAERVRLTFQRYPQVQFISVWSAAKYGGFLVETHRRNDNR